MAGLKNSRLLILEEVCATTPDNHHYLIIHAKDTDNGKTVWAIGDDQVGAIASEDFIRNKDVNYNDVCIQEFPYHDYTPESVGIWRTLIDELVKFTLQKYMEHDGLVHVYPQWIPEDLCIWAGKESYEKILKTTDHIILYENNTMDFVPLNSDIEEICDEPKLNI